MARRSIRPDRLGRECLHDAESISPPLSLAAKVPRIRTNLVGPRGLRGLFAAGHLERGVPPEQARDVDPAALALAIGLIAAAGLIACALAARGAARVDPNVVLRDL